ncbi:MAG: hypothetical protein J1E04_01500 [Alistipes sp.]|nr:hypothetical protein [Alistipes sp.]
MKMLKYIKLALAGISLALVSCSDMPEQETAGPASGAVPAEIEVSLPDSFRPATRRTVDTATDSWTTKSFSANDRIGLFATTGMVKDGKLEPIFNEYMEYYQATGSSNYRFRNDELMINPGMMTGKVGRYVYFPYCPDMPSPNLDEKITPGSNKWFYAKPTAEKPGMLLRRTHDDDPNIPEDGCPRCVDYMYISNMSISNGAISGGFYHGFCELIILRGKGFDQIDKRFPTDTDDPEVNRKNKEKHAIKVVLNRPVTRMTLAAYMTNSTGQYSWMPQLYPEANQWANWATDGKVDGLTEEEAMRWEAWQGEDYIDSNNGEPEPRPAWYAIIPTQHGTTYTIANFIEIYNDEGLLCPVTNFDLYVNPDTGIADKQMRPNYRFAVEIMMTESGALARPVEISKWIDSDGELEEGQKDSHDITDERTSGIGSHDALLQWRLLYNDFVGELNNHTINRPTAAELESDTYKYKELRNYGDYDFTENVWKFYVTTDIDLKEPYTYIDDLQDVLEGASPNSRFAIRNLRNTFIKKISNNGSLRNLDFEKLYVKPSVYDDGTSGALTNRLEGSGSIENCHINEGTMVGDLSSDRVIGMLCGTVNGGTVKNCEVSGAMIGYTFGDDTYDGGLFGKVNDIANYFNNDATGLILMSY